MQVYTVIFTSSQRKKYKETEQKTVFICVSEFSTRRKNSTRNIHTYTQCKLISKLTLYTYIHRTAQSCTYTNTVCFCSSATHNNNNIVQPLCIFGNISLLIMQILLQDSFFFYQHTLAYVLLPHLLPTHMFSYMLHQFFVLQAGRGLFYSIGLHLFI